MRGYFAVDIRDKEHVGHVTDYHILFKSPGTIDSADLADCLKDGLRRTLFPDAVVIVCVPEETELILEVLKKNPDAQQALARASSKVCVAICAIDKSGVLTSPKYVRNPRQSLPLIESKLQGNIYEEGLKALFSVKNVLVEAPAGFTFVKPSQDRSTFFLRAEEALFETDRVNFLAYALLERIAKREESAKGPIEIIFIDTMAIASLAYILRELYAELFGHPPPRVVSFHSYGGIEDVPRPRAGTSLCLISASSSMNMHRKWLNLTH